MLTARTRQAPRLIYPESSVEIAVAFLDGSAATDPTTVTFKLMSPECTESSFVYGTDSEVVKDSVGNYTATVTADKAGRWRYRWVTTGPVFVTEGDFLVQHSAFVDDPGSRDYY